ncbi:PREDICTED: uncharacterized protein LOC109130919 [Camelina sativa]|uniref:Uncharacterized protein LOC109130918 n=1 Tax=Camelina sativa TaxID=90675 RepID=A0ABM1RC34_CAMSA|nr:PREDICTED: uncharacterized protein LOC109130918 [Camelina sativa]XP_019096572.1 PREDICTED: uncharacterized protein LOC109130919 [Camelina sativa]
MCILLRGPSHDMFPSESPERPNCLGFRRSYRLFKLSTATTLRSLEYFPLTKWFAWLQLDGSSVLTLEPTKTLTVKPTSLALPSTPLIPLWSRFDFHSLPKFLTFRIYWSIALPLNWKMLRFAKAVLNPTCLDLCVTWLFGCTRQEVSECRVCILSGFSTWSSRVPLGSRVSVSSDRLDIYLCRGKLITLVWRTALQRYILNPDPPLWRFMLLASVDHICRISPNPQLLQPQRITRLEE